jgi:hypothetical protein
MIMNIYCQPLNLSIPPLNENFDITKITARISSIGLDELHPEMKEWLDNVGLRVTWIELFYRTPFSFMSIHTDTSPGDFTKINWVYGGRDSTMTWYKLNDSDPSNKSITKTDVNTSYTNYTSGEVTPIFSSTMSGPHVVQVGIPHSISNPREKRYCLSFVVEDKSGKRLSMAETCALLANYII